MPKRMRNATWMTVDSGPGCLVSDSTWSLAFGGDVCLDREEMAVPGGIQIDDSRLD